MRTATALVLALTLVPAASARAGALSLGDFLDGMRAPGGYGYAPGYGNSTPPPAWRAPAYGDAPAYGQAPAYQPPYPTSAPEDPEARGPVPVRSDPLMTKDALHDVSLRPGDAVVTTKGILVFVGDPDADPHARADFVPEARAAAFLGRAAERRLAALDPTNPAVRVLEAKGVAVGRSAAEATPVPGRVVADARGRSVRYVGP